MDKKEYRRYAVQSANGDAKAFAKLYGLINRNMYYTAFYTLKTEKEAVSAVTEIARETFGTISNLHSEQQFCTYMMKALCAKIKAVLKRYPDNSLDDDQPEIKELLFELPSIERMIAVMYIAGKFSCDDIASFMGMTSAGVRKKLERAKQKLGITE